MTRDATSRFVCARARSMNCRTRQKSAGNKDAESSMDSKRDGNIIERCPMKILVISNLYPPHYVGGYELHCEQITEGLRARGHEIQVLTSDYVADESRPDRPYV